MTTTAAKPTKLSKATIPADLDALAAVALASIAKTTDEQRDGVSADAHPIDLELRIRLRGELRIGADTSTTQINKLKPWHLCRLLTQRLPPAVLQECLDQAVAAARSDQGSDVMEAESDDLKARAEACFEQAGLAVKQKRRGNVAFYGEVTAEAEEG